LAPAGAGHPIGDLRIQLSPTVGTVWLTLGMLRSLLKKLEPRVRFLMAIEPGANVEALHELLDEMPRSRGRIRLLEMGIATIFAQDNARPAQTEDGRPVLLLPREFGSGHRAGDALRDEMVRTLGVEPKRSQLFWEGGNLVSDDVRCLIGADTIAQNVARLGLTAAEVGELFTAELGCEVLVMGDPGASRYDLHSHRVTQSGQASFHLDLDVSLLGRFARLKKPRALVADPAAGLDFMPEILKVDRLFAGHFLPSARVRDRVANEFEWYGRERHPKLLAYAETLERAGYTVVGMPDLRVDDGENVFGRVNLDFGYCNVLPGSRRGVPSVYYTPWGIDAFDRAAERQMREAGAEPIRVCSPAISNALMLLRGGLHCFCGTMPAQSMTPLVNPPRRTLRPAPPSACARAPRW
jgi:hypothetical protein